MTWKTGLIPPLAIYAVVFLFISFLIGFKIDPESTGVWIVTLLMTIVGLSIAVSYAQPATASEGLTYGVVWLIVLVILDLVLTVPFTGWQYFSDWRSYLPYGLTLLMPVLLPRQSRTSE